MQTLELKLSTSTVGHRLNTSLEYSRFMNARQLLLLLLLNASDFIRNLEKHKGETACATNVILLTDKDHSAA